MFGAPVRVDEVGAKHSRRNGVELRIEGLAAPDGAKIDMFGGNPRELVVLPESSNLLNYRSGDTR